MLARLSVAASYSDSPERRGRLAGEAVAMARRLGSARCLAHALAAHCDTIAGPADAERRAEEATEIVALARGEHDLNAELLGLRLRVVARLEQGDVIGAEADMRAFGQVAEILRQPLYGWFVPLWRGFLAQLRGDFDEVLRCADEAAHLGALVDSRNALALSLTQRMWVDIEHGDVDRLRAYLERMSAELPEMLPSAGSVYSTFPGQPDHVRRSFLPHLAEALEHLPKDDSEFASYLVHTTTAMFEGADDAEYAELVRAELLPHRHRFVVDGIGAGCMGSAERPLGMLAALAGRYDEAAGHFRRALEADGRTGSAVHPAATHRAHGIMLLRAGDADGARPHLARAREAYAALGCDGRVAEIEDLLGGASAPSTPTPCSGERERCGGSPSAAAPPPSATARAWQTSLCCSQPPVGRPTCSTWPGLPARRCRATSARCSTTPPARRTGAASPSSTRRSPVETRPPRRSGRRCWPSCRPPSGSAAARVVPAVPRSGPVHGHPPDPDAIRLIEESHPELGRHLRASVRTGVFCSYVPETEQRWITT